MTRLQSIKVAARHLLYRVQYALYSGERKHIHIMTPDETLDRILRDRCSVCRFGDGEIEMITCLECGFDDSRSSAFQPYNQALAKRLKEIISEPFYREHNIIVGLPYVMVDMSGLKDEVRKFWRRCYVNNRKYLLSWVRLDSAYADTNFTRFYIDFTDKNKGDYVEKCKKIWDGRDVYFVEGTQSRLGVGNDLFSNARSVKRILGPAINAFESYDQILSAVKELCPKDGLVLLALGQTATVLAYDLAMAGYQAIDLGHIDIEYEWFRMQASEKVPIRNKYVNELKAGRVFSDINDQEYISQIMARID